MKRIIFLFLFPMIFLSARIEDVEALYSLQDPQGLSKLLAFYHLHHDNDFGEKALEQSFALINKHREKPIHINAIPMFHRINLDSLLASLTKQPEEKSPVLSEQQIEFIDKLSDHLKHRKLKGHSAKTTEDILKLPTEEVDLARAIFLSQYGEDQLNVVKSYEATLDLFALSILARLDKGATDREVIEQISYFIFYEMLFRFPPHSLWITDVDQYTFLPSILDSHHGVCLGVSILYLSLAQRLGLDLTICTPPGHIYLSHHLIGEDELNIETTARGIHLPTKNYLSIQTKAVEHKNLKEVIGLHHINAASTHWQAKNHLKAIEEYQNALKFMPDDPLTMTFLGYNYLFTGDKKTGIEYLKRAKSQKIEGSISTNTIIEDYLHGNVDEEGILAIYEHLDETRESIFLKQKKLREVLKKHPTFREGIFHLAVTWLQLGRKKEALEILNQYHELDPLNPIVEYYLTHLNFVRLKPTLAKRHFKGLKFLLEKQNHHPECLKELSMMLKTSSLID
jgi:tetratricopeptide (TPR) repeat protein